MSLEAFIGTDQALVIAIKALVSYWYVVILLRIAGKRTTMSLTTFDFVSTVAMATIIGSTIVSPSISLIEGLTAITALVGVQWIVGYISARSERVRNVITSAPTLLFEHGRFIEENLRAERMSREQLLQKVRAAGHAGTGTVSQIVLESAGSVSIVSRPSSD